MVCLYSYHALERIPGKLPLSHRVFMSYLILSYCSRSCSSWMLCNAPLQADVVSRMVSCRFKQWTSSKDPPTFSSSNGPPGRA